MVMIPTQRHTHTCAHLCIPKCRFADDEIDDMCGEEGEATILVVCMSHVASHVHALMCDMCTYAYDHACGSRVCMLTSISSASAYTKRRPESMGVYHMHVHVYVHVLHLMCCLLTSVDACDDMSSCAACVHLHPTNVQNIAYASHHDVLATHTHESKHNMSMSCVMS